MTSSQDGRLELDDLGSVIDDATSLGDAGETLADEHDAESIGQRVAASGIGAWAARHRVALRVVGAVAAASAVAFVVRTATAPPDPSPDVVATVAPDLTGTEGGIELGGTNGGGAVMTSVWLLSGTRPGESVRLTGVRGPGIRASTARTVGGTEATVQRWAVSAVLGCEDTDSERGTDATTAYSISLERTDAWGRIARTTVPMPATPTDLPGIVSQVCWGDQAAAGVAVQGLTARADTHRGLVTVGLDITSTLGLPVLVGLLDDTTSTTQVGRSFVAPLVPGPVTELDATLRVTSCPAAPPTVLADPRVSGGGTQPGLPLLVQAARDDRTAVVPFVLDSTQRAAVQDALDEVCAGSPDFRAETVSARTAPGAVGVEGTVALDLVVRLSSTAEGDAIVALDWGGYLAGPGSTQGAVPGLGPRGRDVTLSLEVQCPATPPPPRLRVLQHEDGRAHPWSVVLDDRVLEDGILAACDGLTPEMLVTSGWPSRVT